jgi:hypothetical protein
MDITDIKKYRETNNSNYLTCKSEPEIKFTTYTYDRCFDLS